MSQDEMDDLVGRLAKLPNSIETTIRTQEEKVKRIAKKFRDAKASSSWVVE
jgi:glucosamine 6-phosphate synthetase-like amidotransferase/phosphosugar isomerase protein